MIEFETLHAGTISALPGAVLYIVQKDDDYSVVMATDIILEIDKENYDKVRAAFANKA